MNNKTPQLKFRPDVMLTDEISVHLPAGEWVAFINWINSHDTDGINYLLYAMLFEQLAPQLYTPASLKGAEAHMDDTPKNIEELLRQQFPTAFTGGNDPFAAIKGPFLVVCDECGSRDEYLSLPFGELTCGHNGRRHGIAEA